MPHRHTGNTVDQAVEWDGLSLLRHNTSVSGGVAILFHKSFTPGPYEIVEILKGRLGRVRACVENHVLVFICVYATTKKTESRVVFRHTVHYSSWLQQSGIFICVRGF